MQKLLLLLILSFFSTQGLAASCPDGSDPTKTVSEDGTYFEYKCGIITLDAPKAEFYQRQYDMNSEVDQILSKRKTINPFLAWNYGYTYNGDYYGIAWTGSGKKPLLLEKRLEFQETFWAYFYEERGYWKDHAKFATNIDWAHDEEYGVTKAMNIIDPTYSQAFADEVNILFEKGLHGVFLDWWHIHHPMPWSGTKQENIMLRMIDEVRKQVGDDFLLMANTNWSKNSNLVSQINGVFLELYKTPYSRSDSFSFAEIAEMEEVIKFHKKHLRYPKLIAFEPWRITDKLDPNNRTSEDNLRFVRLYSAMATVIPEHGYILYADNNPDFDIGDHDHHYYDVYSVDLGKPVSKYTPIVKGVAYKKFEKGYIAFNRLEYDVKVNFGDFESVIPSMDAVFLNEDGTPNFCIKDSIMIDGVCEESGQKTYWHENGKISLEENYKDGKKEGKSTAWYPTGEIQLEINYKDGKKEGKSSTWYKNGQLKSKVNYKNDKKEGVSTSWYQSGEIKSEINYKDDKKEGVSTSWYQSGEIKSEINYKNNFKENKSTSWYVNGKKKAETNYKDGKKEGKSTVWYQSGQKKSEANYKDNTTDGKRIMWYENGQKKSEGNYKAGNAGFTDFSGLKEGKFTTWYENGQKKSEENYIDNKREGKRTMWYENGQVMYKDNFKDGKLDGKKTNWHENGQIKSEENYNDGIRI
jgi:antitoxin component YwqK of YwqJK toxin-antitoxin module